MVAMGAYDAVDEHIWYDDMDPLRRCSSAVGMTIWSFALLLSVDDVSIPGSFGNVGRR